MRHAGESGGAYGVVSLVQLSALPNAKRGLCLCTAGARPMPTHATHRRNVSSNLLQVRANGQREKTDVIQRSTCSSTNVGSASQLRPPGVLLLPRY